MRAAVGGRGLLNGHSAWYSCLRDLHLVPVRLRGSPTHLGQRGFLRVITYQKVHGFL